MAVSGEDLPGRAMVLSEDQIRICRCGSCPAEITTPKNCLSERAAIRNCLMRRMSKQKAGVEKKDGSVRIDAGHLCRAQTARRRVVPRPRVRPIKAIGGIAPGNRRDSLDQEAFQLFSVTNKGPRELGQMIPKRYRDGGR